MDLLKRSIAECIGTLILVFIGCGTVCVLGGDLLGIAAAFGLAVTIMIYTIGSVSGCHINPAVSIALCAAKKFPVKDTAAYCTAQFIGASLGAGLIILVMGMDALTSGGLGMTAPAVGISVFQAVLAEFIGTFILMMVIMGVAVDRRAVSGFAGLAIGASVLAVILVIGKISGGSINPARTFGPDLMALIFSGSDALWTTFPIYVIGPILGAVCAALLYCKMAGKDNC
ncbi:MAG TPA: aquaporin family protein [Methanocorpusculum sp.]|nr:aquaporin family protein [Methanocorpusculum sp.]HJJ76050.1 aquaporin family protein [Methanocorpusculum sp.]